MMNDDTLTRMKWDPSPEEFKAYLKREVEMARENIAKLRATNSQISGNTLHTQRTLLLAAITA